MNKNITLVTGLWDMGRGNLEGWAKRDFEYYKNRFFEFLETDVQMCIWIPKDLEEEVLKIRGNKPTKNAVLEKINALLTEKYFETVKPIKADNYDLVQLGINMRDKLDKIIKFDEIDLVIVENQISPLANRMKTLQGMIAQYFIMKNVNNIIFYSASNKLKPFLENQKTTYKERKQLGIEFTIQLLDGYSQINSWTTFFSKHSKKDDLADSFLQGLSYFTQHKNLLINL